MNLTIDLSDQNAAELESQARAALKSRATSKRENVPATNYYKGEEASPLFSA